MQQSSDTASSSKNIPPGIFSVYIRGRLWAPVPMQNTLIFSQFDKKIPNQKMNFSSFQ